jgi:DNA-binding beta-propeller fold protein YncE
VAVAPNGRTAVVTCPDASTVEVINLTTGGIAATIIVGQYPGLPYSVAIDPDGSTAYVVNFNGSSPADTTGTVVPVLLRSGKTLPPIRLSGPEAIGAAITPDGRRLLVGVRGTTTTGGAVDVIDTATRAVVAVRSVPVPNGIAVAPDGGTAYVASPMANTITALSLRRDGAATARSGIGTGAVAVTPDQMTLVSADSNGQEVDLLALPSLQTRGYAPTASGPIAVAVAPDQAPRASLERLGPNDRSVTLDASRSTSASTPIVSYQWDFGDGTRTVTKTAAVSHTYRHPGRYRATVTVSDSAGTSVKQVFTGQTVSRNGGPSARATLDLKVR